MKNSIARISLIIFMVVAVCNFFMPAMPGGLVAIFGFLSIVAIAMVMVGTKKFKIIGVACFLLSVTLLISDYRAGKEYHAKMQKQLEVINSQKKD